MRLSPIKETYDIEYRRTGVQDVLLHCHGERSRICDKNLADAGVVGYRRAALDKTH